MFPVREYRVREEYAGPGGGVVRWLGGPDDVAEAAVTAGTGCIRSGDDAESDIAVGIACVR
jgi:hypothetical protein